LHNPPPSAKVARVDRRDEDARGIAGFNVIR
jgi:hypothetical protein